MMMVTTTLSLLTSKNAHRRQPSHGFLAANQEERVRVLFAALTTGTTLSVQRPHWRFAERGIDVDSERASSSDADRWRHFFLPLSRCDVHAHTLALMSLDAARADVYARRAAASSPAAAPASLAAARATGFAPSASELAVEYEYFVRVRRLATDDVDGSPTMDVCEQAALLDRLNNERVWHGRHCERTHWLDPIESPVMTAALPLLVGTTATQRLAVEAAVERYVMRPRAAARARIAARLRCVSFASCRRRLTRILTPPCVGHSLFSRVSGTCLRTLTPCSLFAAATSSVQRSMRRSTIKRLRRTRRRRLRCSTQCQRGRRRRRRRHRHLDRCSS